MKVPSGARDAYRNADIWKNFINITGRDISAIAPIHLDAIVPSRKYIDNNRLIIEKNNRKYTTNGNRIAW